MILELDLFEVCDFERKRGSPFCSRIETDTSSFWQNACWPFKTKDLASLVFSLVELYSWVLHKFVFPGGCLVICLMISFMLLHWLFLLKDCIHGLEIHDIGIRVTSGDFSRYPDLLQWTCLGIRVNILKGCVYLLCRICIGQCWRQVNPLKREHCLVLLQIFCLGHWQVALAWSLFTP